MELMATLVLAHLLADFPLQSNAIAAAKAKSLYGLIVHVMVHVLVLWTLLGFCKTAWALILEPILMWSARLSDRSICAFSLHRGHYCDCNNPEQSATVADTSNHTAQPCDDSRL